MNPTALVLGSLFGIGILWEFFALYKWGVQATISVVSYRIAQKWPVIPFALGALIAHIFFGMTTLDCK